MNFEIESTFMEMMSECYAIRTVFIAQLGLMISSCSLSWSSPMIPKLNGTEDNPLGRHISDTEEKWLVSYFTIGACLGTGFAFLASKYGRKPIYSGLGFPILIANLIMAFAQTIQLFFFARFLSGISLGGLMAVLPMYVGEVASPKNRGILGSATAVFINFGMLLPFCFGPFISIRSFHLAGGFFSGIYIIMSLFFTSESPYFLIQDDYGRASDVLKKLRGSNFNEIELNEMKEDIRNTSEGSLIDNMKTKAFTKAFIIGIGLQYFLIMTGGNVLIPFTQSIFESAGFDSIPPTISPILVGLAELIACASVSCIADKFPRKRLYIFSHAGVSVSLLGLGIYFYLKNIGHEVKSISWLPLVCLISFVSFYNIGVGPICFTIMGEIFTPRVKGIAISILIISQWGGSSVLLLGINPFTDLVGNIGITYWVFAISSFLAVLFIHFFVIETKGKTLREIQERLNASDHKIQISL